MSWLNTSIANLAKNALKEAQKTIDKALDIRETEIIPTSTSKDPVEEETEEFSEEFNDAGEEEAKSTTDVSTLPEVVVREPVSKVQISKQGENEESNLSGSRLDENETSDSVTTIINLDDQTIPAIVNCNSPESVSRVSSPENDIDIEWGSDTISDVPDNIYGQREVSTLLTEAMKDSVKAETSTSVSGDEIETTTSSDIEIIASPQAGIRKIQNSRISQVKTHSREPSEASSDGSTTSTGETLKSHAIESKILQLNQLLVDRDNQQLELARKCNSLTEEVERLKSLLAIDEKEKVAAGEAIRRQTDEFAVRLSSVEKRYQQALAQRDALNQKLEQLKKKQFSQGNMTEMMREKDETIKQLQFEGEKLSKTQLKQSNVIKQLRAKEKEEENRSKQLQEANSELKNEVDRLNKSLSAKDDIEKNQIEAIRQLTITNDQLVMELTTIKVMLREKITESDSLKSSLEETEKKLSEIEAEAAVRDSAEVERCLSAEVSLRQRLQVEYESTTSLYEQEKQALTRRCQELAESLADIDSHHSREKERMQNEVSQLMHRLQETESRSDELSQALASATRPLLRQIETLQQTLVSLRTAEENSTRALKERLTDVEHQLLSAQKNVTSDQDKYAELQTKIDQSNDRLASLDRENQKLSEELAKEKTNREITEETRAKDNLKSDLIKNQLMEDIKSLQQKIVLLETNLGVQSSLLDEERKKTCNLTTMLQEKELDQQIFITDLNTSKSIAKKPSLEFISRSSSPTPSLGKLSLSGSFTESHSSNPWNTADEVFDGGLTTPVAKSTLYDTMRAGSYTAIFESLQAQLKTRDGEVTYLQQELNKQEKSRDSLAKELTAIIKSNQELTDRLDSLETIRTECDDLKTKYNALLQMYGEKIEENEELRLDLVDVKEMYKAQIDQLMKM